MVTKLVTSGNSFKLLLCIINIEQKRKISATTRQERERAVLDLYHNQRKTIQDIAKEARISFRDRAILNKSDELQKRKEKKNNNKDSSSYLYPYKLTSYFLRIKL
jgi:type II restriction/modification system DNA methylase subunit YeeA